MFKQENSPLSKSAANQKRPQLQDSSKVQASGLKKLAAKPDKWKPKTILRPLMVAFGAAWVEMPQSCFGLTATWKTEGGPRGKT